MVLSLFLFLEPPVHLVNTKTIFIVNCTFTNTFKYVFSRFLNDSRTISIDKGYINYYFMRHLVNILVLRGDDNS